jgi:hypothetical protein
MLWFKTYTRVTTKNANFSGYRFIHLWLLREKPLRVIGSSLRSCGSDLS